MELPNFRKALEWAAEAGDPALGLQLMFSLEQFWVAQAPFEGRLWLERLLPRSNDVSATLRARALLTYGGLVFIVGEFARGTEINEESLALYRSIGDERGAASVLNRLIYSAVVEDDLAKARTLAEESLEIQRRFADTLGEAGHRIGAAVAQSLGMVRDVIAELLQQEGMDDLRLIVRHGL